MNKRPFARAAILTLLSVGMGSISATADDAHSSERRLNVEGDISFSIVTLDVSADDLRPYIPRKFKSFGTGGRATILVGAGFFTNIVSDGRPIPDFEWSELFAFPSGDPGNPIPTPRGFYVWRLADRSEPLEGLSRVGLTCGRRSTFVCQVPELSLTRRTSGPARRVEAQVPWAFSPYSMSTTFATGDVVPVGFPDTAVWHRGTFGIVREDFHGSNQTTALGVGSVRTPRGTRLYRILGERTEVSGTALSWSFHFVARFTVTDEL